MDHSHGSRRAMRGLGARGISSRHVKVFCWVLARGVMRLRMFWAVALAAGCLLLAASPLIAADFPEWAYPVNPKAGPLDVAVLKTLPGSEKKYTQAQVEDDF